MSPNLFQMMQDRLEKFLGIEPVMATKREGKDTPEQVLPHKPSPAQALAQELEKVVTQMMEFETSAESFKAHTYINEIGKRSFGKARNPSNSIIMQAMQVAESAMDDMVDSFSASFGPRFNLASGHKRSKDGKEPEDRQFEDISMSDNRSSVMLFDGTVLTYTKVVDEDNKVEAVKPRLEVTTPDGGKASASLSDGEGLKRILSAGVLGDAFTERLQQVRNMISDATNAIVDAQINGAAYRPDLDAIMRDAQPGPNGYN